MDNKVIRYNYDFLHLWTFKKPTLTLKKIQKCKINIDGLTFSSSLLLLKK